jgi:hypothetical protein
MLFLLDDYAGSRSDALAPGSSVAAVEEAGCLRNAQAKLLRIRIEAIGHLFCGLKGLRSQASQRTTILKVAKVVTRFAASQGRWRDWDKDHPKPRATVAITLI